MSSDVDAIAEAAGVAALEATGRYRVLRRVPSLPTATLDNQEENAGVGVMIDLETTGLDPDRDEPIELAMVKFLYDRADGRFIGVTDTFSALAEPSIPIPAAVTRLTGISAADVGGRTIDAAQVTAFVEPARLVVAHNARFDRPFSETSWPVFATRPWACSCTGVDWSARGFEGAGLGYLLLQSGHYHEAHRALDDVTAALHLLTLRSSSAGTTALAELLAKAREPTARVWAEGAPYRHKDELRRRGYRWSDGARDAPRAWFRDVPIDAGAAEAAFLRREVYEPGGGAPRIALVTARERFSDRAGAGPLPKPATRATHSTNDDLTAGSQP